MPKVIATWNGYVAERPAGYKNLPLHLLYQFSRIPFMRFYSKEARLKKALEGYKALTYYLVSNGPENTTEQRKKDYAAQIDENLSLLKKTEAQLLVLGVANVQSLIKNSSVSPQTAMQDQTASQAWDIFQQLNLDKR